MEVAECDSESHEQPQSLKSRAHVLCSSTCAFKFNLDIQATTPQLPIKMIDQGDHIYIGV
jgi:hypothetical protein